MKIAINHTLEENIALEKLKNLIQKVKNEYSNRISDVTENWTSNSGSISFTVSGHKVSANVITDNSTILLTIVIPFFFNIFKSQIKQVVEVNIKEALK